MAEERRDGGLVAKLRLKKTAFKPGEVLEPVVRLENKSGSTILIIGRQSEESPGQRMPLCTFEQVNLDGTAAKFKNSYT